MAQKRIIKRKTSPELDRRFTNIESKIQAIEDHIASKFKAMEDQMESEFQAVIENYMNDRQNNTNHFDRIHSDLEEIKKNTKSKGISLYSRKKKTKKDDVHSVESIDATGEDKGVQSLLDNPIIQSLLSLDLSQIGALLQNPMIQSLFTDSKDNKNDRSRNKGKKRRKSSGSSGLNLSIGNLLQNPRVQSFLKSH